MGRKNKRSIEDIGRSDGISPPSKMAPRGRSDSKSDEILTKLDALGARLSNLEKEVTELTKALREMEVIRNDINSMKDTCEGFQRMEIDSKKRSVLIRGLPFRTSEKFETRAQTKLVLADLFKRLDMTPHLVDYQRLGGLKDNENGSKVAIRVQFVTVDQKFDLFDALKQKGRAMDDISIGTKTRIVPKGLGLILQKRSNAQDRWTAVSLPGGPFSSRE